MAQIPHEMEQFPYYKEVIIRASFSNELPEPLKLYVVNEGDDEPVDATKARALNEYFNYLQRKRDRHEIKDLYLRHADMLGLNLVGSDLSRTDLSGAELESAILVRTVCKGVRFKGAHLVLTDFRGADMWGADLSGAKPLCARFESIWVQDWPYETYTQHVTDLRDADMSDAVLRGCDMSDAVLRGAKLRRAHLSNCHMQGADLRGCDMYGATLSNVFLDVSILLEEDSPLIRGKTVSHTTAEQQKQYRENQPYEVRFRVKCRERGKIKDYLIEDYGAGRDHNGAIVPVEYSKSETKIIQKCVRRRGLDVMSLSEALNIRCRQLDVPYRARGPIENALIRWANNHGAHYLESLHL